MNQRIFPIWAQTFEEYSYSFILLANQPKQQQAKFSQVLPNCFPRAEGFTLAQGPITDFQFVEGVTFSNYLIIP
jgi:hypothetical protein